MLNAGCSLLKPIKKEHALAYLYLMDNDTEKARVNLDKAKDNYIKKFLLASIELTEGNLEIAKHHAEGIITANKDIPDGKVLLNLIERRNSFPDERWSHSYAMAWREAGSPELKVMAEFSRADWPSSDDYERDKENEKEAIKCTPDNLLVSYGANLGCENKEDFENFLGQISPNLPLEIKLLLLRHLDCEYCLTNKFEISDELKQKIRGKRYEIIHHLSAELPSDMKFAIMDVLELSPKEGPFSLKDIEILEKAVSRQRLAPPKHELFSIYLKHYKLLGEKNPYFYAYTAANVTDFHFIFVNFTKKITASAENASPHMKKRLADILEKLGLAYLKRRMVLDLFSGIYLINSAYKIRGDEEAENRLKKESIPVRNILNAASLSASSVIWPITPLMIDTIKFQMKDELGYYLLLTGEEMPEGISELINGSLSNQK
jgi:hypothetical protein